MHITYHTLQENNICYGRIAHYVHRLIREDPLMCTIANGSPVLRQAARYSDFDGVPFFCFEEWHAMGSEMRQWFLSRFCNILVLESEPHANLINLVPEDEMRVTIITLNPSNIRFWQARGVKVHFLAQGHLATTRDPKDSYHRAKDIDILFPGGDNSPARQRIVKALRAEGYSVDVSRRHADSLDDGFARATISLYYPCSREHHHFATQRHLWAIASGQCRVLTTQSSDDVAEELFQQFYDSVPFPSWDSNYLPSEADIRAMLDAVKRIMAEERQSPGSVVRERFARFKSMRDAHLLFCSSTLYTHLFDLINM